MSDNANVRRKMWCCGIIVSVVLCIIALFCYPSKNEIYVKAPSDMKSAFSIALFHSENMKDYKIAITDSDELANITIIEGGENKEGNERIAYSPFICATAVGNKDLEQEKIFVDNRFDEDLKDIDVKTIISGVIKEDYWANSKCKDLKNLIVYYPAESTSYWYDFYNFLIITLNDGEYPQSDEEMTKIEESIAKFLNSKKSEAVADFSEKMNRNNGFTTNTIYFIPEKLAMSLSADNNKKVKLYYPIYTVYYNYYLKYDEIGGKIINAVNEHHIIDSYDKLYDNAYRTERIPNLDFVLMYSNVYGLRNTYEVINDLNYDN